MILEPVELARHFGHRVVLATETFQQTGSFKFRGALNVAKAVSNQHLIAASSGNFGQALACACKLTGKQCTIVMPQDSASIKVDAVRRHGARIELVDVRVKTRQQRVEELKREFPDAYVASAYDDDFVIAGNATLARELAAIEGVDTFIAPIGGGGLASGVIRGFADLGRAAEIFGAEPLLANDAARSLREGRIVLNEDEPATLADGARAISIGKRNWEILRRGLVDIVEVSEEQIAEALRLLFHKANLKAEPTGALALGALLAAPERFVKRSVCCIVSGGNIDASRYAALLCPVPDLV